MPRRRMPTGIRSVPKVRDSTSTGNEKEGKAMNCPKCKSKNLELVTSGPHNKLVCADCLAFVKFLKKAEAKNWKALKERERP